MSDKPIIAQLRRMLKDSEENLRIERQRNNMNLKLVKSIEVIAAKERSPRNDHPLLKLYSDGKSWVLKSYEFGEDGMIITKIPFPSVRTSKEFYRLVESLLSTVQMEIEHLAGSESIYPVYEPDIIEPLALQEYILKRIVVSNDILDIHFDLFPHMIPSGIEVVIDNGMMSDKGSTIERLEIAGKIGKLSEAQKRFIEKLTFEHGLIYSDKALSKKLDSTDLNSEILSFIVLLIQITSIQYIK